jgi:hypothetical protein
MVRKDQLLPSQGKATMKMVATGSFEILIPSYKTM